MPLIGNVAEHLVAVTAAMKNRMELSMTISLGSSLQIALFVAPALVFISLLMGNPMTLEFNQFELVALVGAALIAASAAQDGESNWLEGAMLLVVILCLAVLVTTACDSSPAEDDIATKVAAGIAATRDAEADVQSRVAATLTAVAPTPPQASARTVPTDTPVEPTAVAAPATPASESTEPEAAHKPQVPSPEAPASSPMPPEPSPTPLSQPPTATPLVEAPTATPLPEPPTPTPTAERAAPRRALVAYTVTETFRQHYRIELINTDGTGHRLLSDMASEPSFSPDGQWVVFYSWPGGLEVMKLDGSERKRIVHDSEAAFPNWSPNGKYIAFHSVRGWESRFNIYIYRRRRHGGAAGRRWRASGMVARQRPPGLQRLRGEQLRADAGECRWQRQAAADDLRQMRQRWQPRLVARQ